MRVIVVDDDKLIAASLKTILEASEGITVTASGSSGDEAVSLYREHMPDILLMDIRMSGMSGLEAAEHILSEFPDAKILFLTTFSDDEYISRALTLGAKGYILKQDFESIVPALRLVLSGQRVFGDAVMNRIPDIMTCERSEKSKCTPDSFGLSDREALITKLVASGLNNKEISSQLFLSEGTVRNCISVILEKLSLRDRTQLTVFYFKNLD